MSDELEVAKAIATHPATGGAAAITLISWLLNKVWRGHRHEIANLKDTDAKQGAAIVKLYEKFDAHALRDEDSFRSLQQQMADNHSEVLKHLLELKR